MVEITIIAIIFAVIISLLKSVNSELTPLALVASGLILLTVAINYFGQTIDVLSEISKYTGIDNDIFLLIIKVTAIGYVAEFGASTVRDLGFSSLADKLILIGKLIIVSMAIPIIYSILNLFMTLIV